ncbi:hypothetical protein, unlikely [Trypanosoma brucei gambiense DAL972]|uniref:Uncharacterized protein n=1 Tax=Trypanosoma brucei gambiense (strain MHOM/CI/86/DAL972) TaxID=679716 RepID=C9ZM95_TRYB9|nr:hypothetical protein, unlikely [Trypanosoma brucei gambiense DAL972]CBH10768.1 hypothetical protein, unlikely [Trypanosoma brucei gambiense DAL972]|eukprot:XP_011773056.1 hypothetical protein, unlikely [Trypanosoma brucei gambiense DAL972]
MRNLLNIPLRLNPSVLLATPTIGLTLLFTTRFPPSPFPVSCHCTLFSPFSDLFHSTAFQLLQQPFLCVPLGYIPTSSSIVFHFHFHLRLFLSNAPHELIFPHFA